MLDGTKLREMLERIEALFLGATTPGERAAAAGARERIEARLGEIRRTDPAVEMQFNMRNPWSKKLLVALLRRYGFKPYRYYRQRHTTGSPSPTCPGRVSAPIPRGLPRSCPQALSGSPGSPLPPPAQPSRETIPPAPAGPGEAHRGPLALRPLGIVHRPPCRSSKAPREPLGPNSRWRGGTKQSRAGAFGAWRAPVHPCRVSSDLAGHTGGCDTSGRSSRRRGRRAR